MYGRRYATFAGLAGVTDATDHKAARAGLPPIDSHNMWPMISGANGSSPREEIPLSGGDVSGKGLIAGRYKLIQGDEVTLCPATLPRHCI